MLKPGLILCQERIPSRDFPGRGSVEDNVFQPCFQSLSKTERKTGKQSRSLRFEAAGGAVMIKKPRWFLGRRWWLKFRQGSLPFLFRTREYLKNKIFTDASKFYASDFNAKTSCYILHQKGRSSSICKTKVLHDFFHHRVIKHISYSYCSPKVPDRSGCLELDFQGIKKSHCNHLPLPYKIYQCCPDCFCPVILVFKLLGPI